MSFCCGWFVAVLWGGGGSFFGEVRWYVFLSLLGWGLAGVLPLGFCGTACVCGGFLGEVPGRRSMGYSLGVEVSEISVVFSSVLR